MSPEDDLVDPEVLEAERDVEASLRPKQLTEFVLPSSVSSQVLRRF